MLLLSMGIAFWIALLSGNFLVAGTVLLLGTLMIMD